MSTPELFDPDGVVYLQAVALTDVIADGEGPEAIAHAAAALIDVAIRTRGRDHRAVVLAISALAAALDGRVMARGADR